MDDGDIGGPILSSIPLLEAVLCADCEVISNSGGEACEICGSRSLLSLGRVLGGCIVGERATLIEVNPDRVRHGFTVLMTPAARSLLMRRRQNGG